VTDSRPTATEITDDQLDRLYDRLDRAEAALHRPAVRRREERPVELLGVRRWSELGETTPVAIDGKSTCGKFSDHARRGCLALSWTDWAGGYSALHLTPPDAARLADLLYAMAGDTACGRLQVAADTAGRDAGRLALRTVGAINRALTDHGDRPGLGPRIRQILDDSAHHSDPSRTEETDR
jgi:hypothetical protein